METESEVKPGDPKADVVKKRKTEKPGIIYLSSVPDFMSVQKLRQTFGEFGEVHRTFFDTIEKSYNFKKGLLFSEGWVEFKDKKVAKYVARCLNNNTVGGKRRYPWYNCIWNIKYLPKFIWTDINADKELKRRTRESRMRAEITQAKKQTTFYAGNMERGKNLDTITNKRNKSGNRKAPEQIVQAKQRLTEDEVVAAKKRRREENKTDQRKLQEAEENEKKHKFVMSSIFG